MRAQKLIGSGFLPTDPPGEGKRIPACGVRTFFFDQKC
jgi:hypothetical protein